MHIYIYIYICIYIHTYNYIYIYIYIGGADGRCTGAGHLEGTKGVPKNGGRK